MNKVTLQKIAYVMLALAVLSSLAGTWVPDDAKELVQNLWVTAAMLACGAFMIGIVSSDL